MSGTEPTEPSVSISDTTIEAHNGSVAVGSAGVVSIQLPQPTLFQVASRRITGDDYSTALFGRAELLRKIVALLERRTRSRETPTVTTLKGLAGVGKSQLAVHTAKALVSGMHYNIAVLVDMNGYSDREPGSAQNAYASILRVLSTQSPPPGESPPGADMCTEYHLRLQQLADSGTAVLLVLDNVAATDQVESLIPTNVEHHVLVTTRDTLNALPRSRAIEVDTLAPTDAADLVTHVVLERLPSDCRASEEPSILAELCALSGYLPLALRIVGSLAAEEPRRRLAELADELRAENTRLGAFEYEDVSVRSAFELSYRRLTPDLQRLFRGVPSIPGPDFGLLTASAVASQTTTATRRALSALARAHLLELPMSERWTMHDLIRLYANELSVQNRVERKAVEARVSDSVVHAFVSAGCLIFNRATPPQLRHFADRSKAESWLTEDRFAIVGVMERCVRNNDRIAHELTKGASEVFEAAHLTSEWVAASTMWVQCAESDSDLEDLNIALNKLGASLRAIRQFDNATSVHDRSLQLYRSRGDRRGQGVALVNMANVLQDQRRYAEAIDLYNQDIQLCREAEDLLSEADTQGNLAAVLLQAGRNGPALDHIERAESLYHDAEYPQGIARMLDLRGVHLQYEGRYEEASTLHRDAAARFERLGERHRQSGALNNALVAENMFSDPQVAIDHHTQELDRLRRLGDLHRQATSHINLGLAQERLSLWSEARQNVELAAELYEQCSDPYGEAKALFLSGLTSAKLGETATALSSLTRARGLFAGLNHCSRESAEVRQAIRAVSPTP